MTDHGSDEIPESERAVASFTFSDQFVNMYMQENIDLLQNSLPFVDNRQERKRRLRLLQTMFVAKAELEARLDVFCMALVDGGIEAIINGDWKEAAGLADHFLYENEDLQLRERYVPLHRVFRETLLRAVNEALPSDPSTLTVKRGGAWGRSKR